MAVDRRNEILRLQQCERDIISAWLDKGGGEAGLMGVGAAVAEGAKTGEHPHRAIFFRRLMNRP